MDASTLRHAVVTLSGFEAAAKHDAVRAINVAGGRVVEDFTDEVSLLIAARGGSRKYVTARQRGIPIVAPSWLNQPTTQIPHTALPPLFGWVVTSTQLRKALQEDCKNLVSYFGGLWTPKLDAAVSLVVVSDDEEEAARVVQSSPKVSVARQYHIPIVRKEALFLICGISEREWKYAKEHTFEQTGVENTFATPFPSSFASEGKRLWAATHALAHCAIPMTRNFVLPTQQALAAPSKPSSKVAVSSISTAQAETITTVCDSLSEPFPWSLGELSSVKAYVSYVWVVGCTAEEMTEVTRHLVKRHVVRLPRLTHRATDVVVGSAMGAAERQKLEVVLADYGISRERQHCLTDPKRLGGWNVDRTRILARPSSIDETSNLGISDCCKSSIEVPTSKDQQLNQPVLASAYLRTLVSPLRVPPLDLEIEQQHRVKNELNLETASKGFHCGINRDELLEPSARLARTMLALLPTSTKLESTSMVVKIPPKTFTATWEVALRYVLRKWGFVVNSGTKDALKTAKSVPIARSHAGRCDVYLLQPHEYQSSTATSYSTRRGKKQRTSAPRSSRVVNVTLEWILRRLYDGSNFPDASDEASWQWVLCNHALRYDSTIVAAIEALRRGRSKPSITLPTSLPPWLRWAWGNALESIGASISTNCWESSIGSAATHTEIVLRDPLGGDAYFRCGSWLRDSVLIGAFVDDGPYAMLNAFSFANAALLQASVETAQQSTPPTLPHPARPVEMPIVPCSETQNDGTTSSNVVNIFVAFFQKGGITLRKHLDDALHFSRHSSTAYHHPQGRLVDTATEADIVVVEKVEATEAVLVAAAKGAWLLQPSFVYHCIFFRRMVGSLGQHEWSASDVAGLAGRRGRTAASNIATQLFTKKNLSEARLVAASRYWRIQRERSSSIELCEEKSKSDGKGGSVAAGLDWLSRRAPFNSGAFSEMRVAIDCSNPKLAASLATTIRYGGGAASLVNDFETSRLDGFDDNASHIILFSTPTFKLESDRPSWQRTAKVVSADWVVRTIQRETRI